MSAQTGMTNKEKLQALNRLSALIRSAEDIIQKGTRSPGDVLLFLEALQAFKERRLASIVRVSHGSLSTDDIFLRCGIEVRDVPFSPEDQRYLKKRGLRYVGEIFSMWSDPRSSFAVETGERIRGVLFDRLGLSKDLDPLALGWKPFYWSDATYTDELAVLILKRYPTSPKVLNWDQSVKNSYYRCRLELHRGAARRLHRRGIHFMGELFIREGNDHCPFGKRATGSLEGLQKELQSLGSRLWAGFLPPPHLTFPDWQGDLWSAELVQLEKEEQELEKAWARTVARRKKLWEEEEAKRKAKQETQRNSLPSREILDRSVETLELSIRAANCLQNAGIETIGQLVVRTEHEMLRSKNFGRKSLSEIKELLVKIGLHIDMTKEELEALPLPENLED